MPRTLFSIALIVLAALLYGCMGAKQIPSNADPREREIASELLTIANDIAWHEDGTVRSADVSGQEIGQQELHRLARLTHLQEINLAGTPITDGDLKALENMPTLEAVDLQWTRIGDEGLLYLSRVPSLRLLVLHNTQISDAGLVDNHHRGRSDAGSVGGAGDVTVQFHRQSAVAAIVVLLRC